MHILGLKCARYENAKNTRARQRNRAIVYLVLCRFYGS